MDEKAAGARRDDDGQIAGFAVKRVVAAVLRIVPRNLPIIDAGRIDLGEERERRRESGAGGEGKRTKEFHGGNRGWVRVEGFGERVGKRNDAR